MLALCYNTNYYENLMFYHTHINYTLLIIKIMINVLLECIKLLSVHIILTYLAVCSIRDYPSDIVIFFIITAMFALLLQEVYLLQ